MRNLTVRFFEEHIEHFERHFIIEMTSSYANQILLNTIVSWLKTIGVYYKMPEVN